MDLDKIKQKLEAVNKYDDVLEKLIEEGILREHTFIMYYDINGEYAGDENDIEDMIETTLWNMSEEEVEEIFNSLE